MRRPRVLIVETEQQVAALIKRTLEGPGEITADVVDTGEAALEAVVRDFPDLIILDLKGPASSGAEIWRALRRRMQGRDVAIVLLTACTSDEDRTIALDLGADDCMTKPFSVYELRARVRAILRRVVTHTVGPACFYRSAHLFADFETMSFMADGRHVRLRRRERDLLQHLITHKNHLLLRDRLLEEVWGYDTPVQKRSVDVHIGRLRTKLGEAGRHIETVSGLGYRFVDEPSQQP
jgi:DNA-binding response OmpR family regulator